MNYEYLVALAVILQMCETTLTEAPVDTTMKLQDSMVLECVYPGSANVTQVSWFKDTASQQVAVANSMHGVYIDARYKERVELANVSVSSRDMSLRFHRTFVADTGYYYCSVHTFPDGIWEKAIKVISSEDFGVTMEPLHHILAELKQNVTFSWQYTLGGRVKQVTWEKIRDWQMDTLGVCNLSEKKYYGSDYKQHITLDCSSFMNTSTVVIQEISLADEGLYRCHFDGDTGNQTFLISLTINKETRHPLLISLIAGGTGLFLILILISVTVYLQKRKRKRKKEKLQSNCKFPTQFPPANHYGRSTYPNTKRKTRVPASSQKDDIYMNCPEFSRKPKTRT
ncbi:CD226 antigen [Microcaecilia unicolor]|uniref:CD226 antigen n=1 Tax=Microcaecilia unicolor TaxID=1415580 RepID=A0A6P7YMF7_9AMPH|nr:CD226 antigen [Microcaecilia unicolor]